MSPPIPVLAAAPITLRHIRVAAVGTTVVGATLAAQSPAGVNGDHGYQTGSYEPALSEDGTARVTFPNAVGDDGVLHRRRFRCLTDPAYKLGDEWIEVWEGSAGRGRVLFVGAPVEWDVTRTGVTLDLVDGAGLLAQQRSFAAGFWWHAPRDVFEHYTKAWRTCVADDFIGGYDAARWVATPGAGATITNQASAVRLGVPPGAGVQSDLSTFGGYWRGVNLTSTPAWRIECRFSQFLVGSAGVAFGIRGGGGSDAATIQTIAGGTVEAILSNLSSAVFIQRALAATAIDVTLAIEKHDRWTFFYAQGACVWAAETNWTAVTSAFPFFAVLDYAGGATGYVDLDYVVVRDLQPYLMRGSDKGDYRLPSSPPPGGLRGAYYDEADLRAVGDTAADFYARVLSPLRKPYARRQDAVIDAYGVTPTWQAPTPPNGEYFSARWTGAIYLDLAAADVTLRLASLDNGARLYVAKTMFGQHLLQQWANPTGAPYTLTSGSLRTHTGGSLTGWYPVRLEYVQGASAGGLSLQQSIGGGAYAVVPATSLSPFGIVEADVRYDSHAEQLRGLVESFGYQYRLEPRSLESGTFPGELVPRIRVGRATDKVLEPPESTDAVVHGSVRDVVSALLADAAGLADQANAAQLTIEALDYAGLWPAVAADRHVAVASGYESLADITDPGLLRTRLTSMLILRSTPWQEVGARPRGLRELRDTFPLTGVLASFDWEPGDSIRLRDEEVDLADDSPRQIIAPAWSFVPDGRGAPTVRFRQRPRSQQDALRQLIRAVLLPQRNYQGQIVATIGAWSQTNSGYSSVLLPRDLNDVVRCDLVIGHKTDATTWTIKDHPAATTIGTFNTPGRVDLMPYLKRRTDSYGANGPEFVVTAIGGTGSVEFALELLVRV